MKIYELKISDELIDDITLDELSDYSSVSEIALVENPAIETEWVYFSKEEFQDTYNDYPRSASDAACRAVRWAEENGWGSCGTNVGKQRAHQLCNREKISEETIARMASFMRHRQHKDVPYDEGCGGLMWDAWGSDEGIKWAQRKLRIIERQKLEKQDFITPNPCWEGYEPIGTKIVDGREVPNCVPLTEMTDDRFEAVVDIDGLPLYKTQSEADSIGASMGCSGSHTHDYEGETLYMPCSNMEETKKLWDEGQTEELNEEKGVELEDILEEGYVISDIVELDEEASLKLMEDYRNKVNGNYTAEQFYNIVADPNAPSIQDGFGKKIRYIYVVGEARAPLISTSRQFCKDMVGKKQLVYRFEDIQSLNAQLTAEDGDRKIIPRPKGTSPNIFIYKGGANCGHKWVQLWFDEDISRIPKKQTRAVSKAEVETNAPAAAGQVNDKVAYAGSKDEDIPAFYEYGLPVYEDMDTCVWKSEMMGCKGEYDEIKRKGKKYYRACKYKEQTEEFKEQFEFKTDEEKRMIYSPAMLPDRLIRRFDGKDEYWVYFTKETIEKIAHKFLMEKRIDKTNLEHTDKKYDDIYLVESWLVSSENDKAYSLGYTKKDVPIGSWMVGYKVKNNDVWENQIKTGKVRGLSVEGEFELITQSFSKDEYIYNKIINILKNTK